VLGQGLPRELKTLSFGQSDLMDKNLHSAADDLHDHFIKKIELKMTPPKQVPLTQMFSSSGQEKGSLVQISLSGSHW
jgi:hypothetical protein